MEDNKHVNPATNPANEGRTSERSEERSAGNGAPGARTSADILREMDSLARRMGIYSEGVYYLIENGAPEEVCDVFTERTDRSAATFIADKLKLEGEERERFMNRETRTAEERELIQSMLLRASAHRLERYFKSKYLEAIGTIAESVETALELKLEELDQKDYDSLATAINMLNRFYFVQVNKEIDPLSGEPLSEAEVEELRKLSRDYVAFHQAQSKPPAESVIDFISPAMGDIIELSAQSDMTFLPLSLIYRDQRSIAARGSEGALENVGKNTDAGEVLVEAHISDKDGNPLTIDAVMQGVQSAIGQLIDENGRVLPIIVTPQQVYRAYARLPNDAKVTMQQAAEMERAMDALMFSPSRLDFTAQLEKHKKIKHQADYNYTDKNAGRLTGNLITAEKGEGTNRLGERQVAYKIFSYPVLYRYSHIVGQIAQVPNKLLTGDDKGAIKDKKTAEAQRNALNIGMRKIVLTRITLWRSRFKQHKPINSALKIQEIADDCNIILTDKVERTLRKNIRQYLDELQSQKAIKRYQEQKDGRRVVGFYVYF